MCEILPGDLRGQRRLLRSPAFAFPLRPAEFDAEFCAWLVHQTWASPAILLLIELEECRTQARALEGCREYLDLEVFGAFSQYTFLYLPQVAENHTPRAQDAPGGHPL